MGEEEKKEEEKWRGRGEERGRGGRRNWEDQEKESKEKEEKEESVLYKTQTILLANNADPVRSTPDPPKPYSLSFIFNKMDEMDRWPYMSVHSFQITPLSPADKATLRALIFKMEPKDQQHHQHQKLANSVTPQASPCMEPLTDSEAVS